MRAFTVALGLSVATAFAGDDIRRIAEIKIGTNTYSHVALKRRNESDVVMLFQGGLKVVKIADLPESLRSEWWDSVTAAAYEKKKAEAGKAALAAIDAQEKEAQKNGVSRAEFYRSHIAENKTLLEAQAKKTEMLLKAHSTSGSLDNNSLADATLEESIAAEQQLQEKLKTWQLRASGVETGKAPVAPARPKAPTNIRIQ